MKQNTKDTRSKIPDHELCAWVDAKGEDIRELIVEAKLWRVKVSPLPGKPGNPNVTDAASGKMKSRHEILAELASYVSQISGEPPNILKAAGALALRATREQTRMLSKHHLVKAIRPNRRLKSF